MSFSQDLSSLYRTIISSLLYACSVMFAMILLFTDILWLHNNASEYSLTEFSQEILLAIIVLLYGKLAYQFPTQRRCHCLIAGFFACLLIRELDAFFDVIFHGFWLYPAFIVAISTIIATFARAFKSTLHELAKFVSDNSDFAYLQIGLICVLVFSRLFGMGILW